MALFTGFDQTMDMSAVLTVMCEADPFVSSGAAVDAKTIKSDVRNKWAHCNFSEWTQPDFNAAFQNMECLVKKMNFSPADEKRFVMIWIAGGSKVSIVLFLTCVLF